MCTWEPWRTGRGSDAVNSALDVTDASIANLIPPTPRPVTRRALLRSWAEPSVQMWWKSAVVVALVMTYVTVIQVREYMRRRYLLEHGLPVKVIVQELNDRKVGTGSYHPMRDVELYVKLVGVLPDGSPFEYRGMLPKAEGFAELGGQLELRVDPNNHARWVEVGKQRPLRHEFMAVFLLMPLIVILLAIARWQRMKVLNVWRHGKLRDAIVVDSRHSSMAPRSRVCRYTIPDGEDRRVFQTLYPSKHGVPQRGDVLPMIVLPEKPGRGVVADLYVREMTT
jgi:hypothetical protein